ncbi:MAG: cation transporting ATPase C-terminal domain-containing protein, partial [Spirochaetota bacterium]
LLVIVYVPFLRPIFDTSRLALVDWLQLLPFTALAAIAAEITKIGLRRRARSSFRGGSTSRPPEGGSDE